MKKIQGFLYISTVLALSLLPFSKNMAADGEFLLNSGFEEFEDFTHGAWAAKFNGTDWLLDIPWESPDPFAGQGCFRISGRGIGEMDAWQGVRTIQANPDQPEGREYEVLAQVFPGLSCSDDVIIRVGFESKIVVDGEIRKGAYQMVELRMGELKKGEWNPIRATAKVGGQVLDNLFVKLWIISKEKDANVDIAFDEVEVSESDL